MKKLIVATALVLAIASSSYAADIPMPVKAPGYVAPVWSWTGFYLGGHLGYGWANTSTSGIGGSGDMDGFFGGGQVGYNWQLSNFVLGIEADISGADISSSNNGTFGGAAFNNNMRIDSFGTIRGRIGVSAWDRSLVYFTGGYAWADQDFSTSAIPGLGIAASSSNSNTRSGYVLGGGIETAINQNWTWGIEYQHLSFDSQRYFNAINIDTDIDTVRLKINYLFH